MLRGEAGIGKTALARVPPRPRRRLPGRPRRRCRVRDGARVRGPAPALRPLPGAVGPAARPAARRARDGLRAAVGHRARPLPGGPGRPHPAQPRSPRSCPWSASSTTRSGWTGLRRRRWSSSPAVCGPSPWPWCSPSGSPTRSPPLAGLPELAVRGLSSRDAGELLDASVPGVLDPGVRDRILAESHGNPLALLELPRGLSAAELAFGAISAAGATPLVHRLEQGFLRRLAPLPQQSRRLLLVGGRRTGRRRPPAVARRAAARHPTRGGDRGRGGGPDRAARPRPVPAPPRPVGRLPVGDARRTAGGPPGARRRHRPGRRPRSPRLAPRPRGGEPGRGGGRRARAVGRPRAGPRRRGGGGRLPRAGRCADARSRRGGCGVRSTAPSSRCTPGRSATPWPSWRPRRRCRSTTPRGRASTWCARRSPSPRTAATTRCRCSWRPRRRLEPLDARLARDTYLDALSAALFAGRLAVGPRRTPRGRSGAQDPAAAHTAQGRRAAGRPRRAVHRRLRPGRRRRRTVRSRRSPAGS